MIFLLIEADSSLRTLLSGGSLAHAFRALNSDRRHFRHEEIKLLLKGAWKVSHASRLPFEQLEGNHLSYSKVTV